MPFWSLQRCCDQSRFHVSLLQRSLLARRTEGRRRDMSFDAETPRPEAPRERLDSLTGIISVFRCPATWSVPPGASTTLQEDEPGPQVRILSLILRLRILTMGSLRSGFPTDSLFQKPTRFFVLSPVSLLSFNS